MGPEYAPGDVVTRPEAALWVRASVDTMVAHPKLHGYEYGTGVPYVSGPKGKACFCLMGGAAALKLASERKRFTVEELQFCAIEDFDNALGENLWIELVQAHDQTKDVNVMAKKVRAILDREGL